MAQEKRIYLALGDSMSIDDYTGVDGGGAVRQFYRELSPEWELKDLTVDGCIMGGVPRNERADLITLTIGGNDALMMASNWEPSQEGKVMRRFTEEHLSLLRRIRGANPHACIMVGNVYAPQTPLSSNLAHLLNQANQAIQANTEKVRAILLDIFGTFSGHENEYLCHEIEPSLKGATAIAGLFKQGYGQWNSREGSG